MSYNGFYCAYCIQSFKNISCFHKHLQSKKHLKIYLRKKDLFQVNVPGTTQKV